MRALKTTFKHIRRNPYQALSAIFIIMQTFFVISVFTFIIFGSARILSYFESLPQVAAFFKPEATAKNVDDLKSKIQETGKVSQMRFVSQQEALERYKKMFKTDPLLLDLVTADVLPASLEISTYKIEDLTAISDMLKQSDAIQEVSFPKEVVSGLITWTDILKKIGTVLVIVMGLDAICVMIIIISIKISQKREEIEIMRLLSATNWFVIKPFIYEGMMYGIIGAILGWAIACGGLWYATPFLQSFFRGVPLLPVSPTLLFELLGVEIIIAMILGIVASSLAVLRYLK
jgi:cell division transport system permease protein